MIRRFIVILLAFAGWLPSSVIGQTLRDGPQTHHPIYFNHDGMWKTAMPTVKTDSTGCPCDSDMAPTQQLTTTEGYYVRIATQGNDIVHCTWPDIKIKIPYTRSLNGGVSFDTVRDLFDTVFFSWKPQWVNFLSNQRFVYFFFVGDKGKSGISPHSLWMLRSSDSGAHWEHPKVILPKDSTYAIAGAALSGDTIAILYVSKLLKKGMDILFSLDGGNTWKRNGKKLPKGYDYRLALTSGYFHLIYVKYGAKNYVGGETMYRFSKNFGKTWKGENKLTTADGYSSWNPSITTGRKGFVSVTWLDGKYGSIGGFGLSVMERHTTNNGKSWSPEKVLSQRPEASWPYTPYVPTISGGGDNIPLGLTWKLDTVGFGGPPFGYQVKLRVSLNGGVSWCNELNLTPNGDFSGNPSIVVTPTRVWVGWEDKIKGIFHPFIRSIRLDTARIKKVLEKNAMKHRWENATFLQNYPNPFNPKTVIRYSLPVNSIVTLNVYNVLGQVVAVLLENEEKHYGAQEVEFNAANLASGVYYYRLDVLTEDGESFSETKKLVVMK